MGIGYANIENEELMRYAVSKKITMQFMLSAQVKSEKSEIDARWAKRNTKSSYSEQTSSSDGTRSSQTLKPRGMDKRTICSTYSKSTPSLASARKTSDISVKR